MFNKSVKKNTHWQIIDNKPSKHAIGFPNGVKMHTRSLRRCLDEQHWRINEQQIFNSVMLKKQIIEQNKCRLVISRFYTLTKGGRGVSVVHHAKTKWIAIIVDKVIPRVSERTKHGPIWMEEKMEDKPWCPYMNSYRKRNIWIHNIGRWYEFICGKKIWIHTTNVSYEFICVSNIWIHRQKQYMNS